VVITILSKARARCLSKYITTSTHDNKKKKKKRRLGCETCDIALLPRYFISPFPDQKMAALAIHNLQYLFKKCYEKWSQFHFFYFSKYFSALQNYQFIAKKRELSWTKFFMLSQSIEHYGIWISPICPSLHQKHTLEILSRQVWVFLTIFLWFWEIHSSPFCTQCNQQQSAGLAWQTAD